MNNIVKTDLRLAKDADVDTILPTNYAHFACEKSIQRFVKVKRVKFHGLDVLESCFISAIDAQR